jgi:hypothetical protein
VKEVKLEVRCACAIFERRNSLLSVDLDQVVVESWLNTFGNTQRSDSFVEVLGRREPSGCTSDEGDVTFVALVLLSPGFFA